MAGDGIRFYAGEYLLQPAGLELSMNWCSHACTYCFANAFSPDRQADLTQIMGLICNYQHRTTREARLIQAGIPILASNHVDVFAGSNAKAFEPIWDICNEMGVSIAYQTRGAHKPQQPIIDRVIRESKPCSWYVSIATTDDTIRQHVEPHAPSVESRLALVADLLSAGHHVSVGINPLTLHWEQDIEGTLDRIKGMGCSYVWMEVPHFESRLIQGLSEKQIDRLTSAFIKRCGANGSKEDLAYLHRAIAHAEEIGINVYSTQHEGPTSYFEPWHQLYPRVNPYLQQVVNWADAQLPAGDTEAAILITKDDAFAAMTAPLDIEVSEPLRRRYRHYLDICPTSDGKPAKQTPYSYWSVVWSDPIFARLLGLLRYGRFAYAATGIKSDGDHVLALDDAGDPLLCYRRTAFPSIATLITAY